MNLQKTLRFIAIGALFLLPLFPLIVANAYFFPFITGKGFYFRILVEIAFSSWLVLAFIDAKYRPTWNSLTVGVTVFAMVTLVADLFGMNPLRSIFSNFERMEGWITIIHLWGLFIVATSLFGTEGESKRWWHRWFTCEIGVALSIAVYGLLQLAGVLEIHQGSSRIDGPLGNSIYMAVYMLMNIGIAAFLLYSQEKKWTLKIGGKDRWIYWWSIVASCIAFYIIYTIGSQDNASYAKGIADLSHSFSLFVHAHPWSFLGGLIVTVVSVLYPYYALPFLFSAMLFETLTRGTSLGLVFGLLVTCVSYVLFASGVTRNKILAVASFVVVELGALIFFIKTNAHVAVTVSELAVLAYLAWLIVYSFKDSFVKTHKHLNIGRWVSLAIIVAMIGGGGSIYLARNTNFIKTHLISKSPVLERLASISLSDTSNQARQYIWPMAVKGAMQRPVFGWGQENFNYIFNANYNPKMYNQEQWFDRAHNVYLDWLTASGIVGILAYLALYVLFVMTVWRSTLPLVEKSILTGLISGYAIHNIFVFDNLASYVLFFIMLSFAATLKTGVRKPVFGKHPVRMDAVEYIVLPTTIIIVVAIVYFFNIRTIQANTALITALSACNNRNFANASYFQDALAINSQTANQEIREQLLSCSAPIIGGQYQNQTKMEFYTLVKDSIKAQTDATPKDARIYVLGGSFWSSLGQANEALPLLETAHKLTPEKQSVAIQLALSYLNSGRKDEALPLLKHAYESEPANGEAKEAYAVGLVFVEKEKEARTLFGDDQSIFLTERMGQVYMVSKQYDKAIELFKKLLVTDPKNIQLNAKLSQAQSAAGLKWEAKQTLRDLEVMHPEIKDQIQTAIKEIDK